jgi:hypothetical protein
VAFNSEFSGIHAESYHIGFEDFWASLNILGIFSREKYFKLNSSRKRDISKLTLR